MADTRVQDKPELEAGQEVNQREPGRTKLIVHDISELKAGQEVNRRELGRPELDGGH